MNYKDVERLGTTARRKGDLSQVIICYIGLPQQTTKALYIGENDDTITLERAAELEYPAHRVALTQDPDFVCAEWVEE